MLRPYRWIYKWASVCLPLASRGGGPRPKDLRGNDKKRLQDRAPVHVFFFLGGGVLMIVVLGGVVPESHASERSSPYVSRSRSIRVSNSARLSSHQSCPPALVSVLSSKRGRSRKAYQPNNRYTSNGGSSRCMSSARQAMVVFRREKGMW